MNKAVALLEEKFPDEVVEVVHGLSFCTREASRLEATKKAARRRPDVVMGRLSTKSCLGRSAAFCGHQRFLFVKCGRGRKGV